MRAAGERVLDQRAQSLRRRRREEAMAFVRNSIEPRGPNTIAKMPGQPAFQFRGDAAVNKDALRRHAGRAAIERQPERQRADHRSRSASARTITASQPLSSIVAGIRCGASCARIFSPVAAEPVNSTLSGRARMAARAASRDSGSNATSCGSKPARTINREERLRGGRSAEAGLEQHGIAGRERLDELHAREQQRVIARPDDENDAKRLAVNFAANTGKPQRPAALAETARGEDLFRVAFKKAAGFSKRKNFGGQGFERGTLPGGGRGFGKLRGVFGDQPAQFANNFSRSANGVSRPARLGGASRSHRARDTSGQVGIGVVEDGGNARWLGGAVHGSGCVRLGPR